MSSFIEWPTIYGSAYFLPGIVIVVLLLALLLLVSRRRRARTERVRTTPETVHGNETEEAEGPEEPAPMLAFAGAAAGHSSGVVTQPVSRIAQPSSVLVEPARMPQSVDMAAQPASTSSLSLVPPPAEPRQPDIYPGPSAPTPLDHSEHSLMAPAAAVPVTVAPVPVAPHPAAYLDQLDTASTIMDSTVSVAPDDDDVPNLARSSKRRRAKAAPVAAPAAPLATEASDPISVTILDLLNGWGDLTPEDMKRLELFRPDRLGAALLAVELPKSKSNDMKVRLNQMRQYATDLARRAEADQAIASAAAPEPPVSAPPIPSGAEAERPEPAAWPAPTPEPRFLSEPLATAPGLPQEPEVKPEVNPPLSRSFYDSDPEVLPPQPGASEPEPNETASLWSKPRPAWEPDPEPALEEIPAPTFEEIDYDVPATQEETPAPEAISSSDERPASMGVPLDTTPLSAALSMGLDAEEKTASSPEPPRPARGGVVWGGVPPARLGRATQGGTAGQRLALPPEERIDMAAFLPPTELVATFRATQDPELKKTVVDTLEHIGSPASLNALGNCFEDTDPDIQIYALAAADRLLGVAQ